MNYQIEKGSHFANFTIDRLWPFTSLPFNRKIKFHQNSWYTREDVEYTGYNKLTGVSGFGIHNNSARLVWQPDFRQKGEIRLHGYVYKDGAHWKADYICSVLVNEELEFSLDYKNGKWVFSVTKENGKTYTLEMDGTKPMILFKAYPYFGGKSTAPHIINIDMK